MAKVTGPLMSMSASGKLGDAIVFFSWKGIDSVRQWIIPANPQSTGQGNIRTIIGGLGKAVGKFVASSPFDVKLSESGKVPAQQTRQSYLVQYIKDTYIPSQGATLKANYATILKELTGHAAYTSWEAGADDLSLVAFGMSYDDIDDFDKALGLYLIAKAAISLNFTGSPYTKTLADWTGAEIDKLVNHAS
jgi:hypothetical protein